VKSLGYFNTNKNLNLLWSCSDLRDKWMSQTEDGEMVIKRNQKTQQGFTLIELVLVIALLGVLAMTALPQYFSISLTNARTNSRDAVVGAVQAGLALYAANQIAAGNAESYPATLDSATAAAATVLNPVFDTIIQNGITRNWTKDSGTCYDYTGSGGTEGYDYSSANGTFVPSLSAGVHVACP
jgi:prepilin-type N-terminal cleavage/methylation domain-containing protein